MSDIAASRVMVDLGAYAHNLKLVRQLIPGDCQIMAIVKANAYGHGAVPVARRAVAEGAAMLGVAMVDEAIALRESGIQAPILILMQPPQDALSAVVEYNLRPMLSDMRAAEQLGDLARKANKVIPIHCKVDSGMGRQGFELEEAVRNMLFLTRVSNIDIEGVATHFPVADLPDNPFTLNQIKQFKQVLRQLDKDGIPYEMAHAANSAAILNYPASAFNMVRPGLMTYGVWPSNTPPVSSPLKRVLRWETQIVIVKELEAGASVGYGRTYTTKDAARVAVLPVGYADGYKHSLSNRADVLIHGKRCPVRGSVCMDQIVVDVTALKHVETGDTVTLIGTDGNESITAEELARHSQSIPYDILAGIGTRVQRKYIE
ncbi:MAG: alanine racemase [Candidatus Hydrogenedentes bacterium]|nr:alanine racemase [Candidatus Hydrogenedentota bacterium]